MLHLDVKVRGEVQLGLPRMRMVIETSGHHLRIVYWDQQVAALHACCCCHNKLSGPSLRRLCVCRRRPGAGQPLTAAAKTTDTCTAASALYLPAGEGPARALFLVDGPEASLCRHTLEPT